MIRTVATMSSVKSHHQTQMWELVMVTPCMAGLKLFLFFFFGSSASIVVNELLVAQLFYAGHAKQIWAVLFKSTWGYSQSILHRQEFLNNESDCENKCCFFFQIDVFPTTPHTACAHWSSESALVSLLFLDLSGKVPLSASSRTCLLASPAVSVCKLSP